MEGTLTIDRIVASAGIDMAKAKAYMAKRGIKPRKERDITELLRMSSKAIKDEAMQLGYYAGKNGGYAWDKDGPGAVYHEAYKLAKEQGL